LIEHDTKLDKDPQKHVDTSRPVELPEADPLIGAPEEKSKTLEFENVFSSPED